MSNETLLDRYQKLTPEAQDDLLTYWNKLISRSKQANDGGGFRITEDYKRTIARISLWSEEDLQPIQDAESGWQWQASEW